MHPRRARLLATAQLLGAAGSSVQEVLSSLFVKPAAVRNCRHISSTCSSRNSDAATSTTVFPDGQRRRLLDGPGLSDFIQGSQAAASQTGFTNSWANSQASQDASIFKRVFIETYGGQGGGGSAVNYIFRLVAVDICTVAMYHLKWSGSGICSLGVGTSGCSDSVGGSSTQCGNTCLSITGCQMNVNDSEVIASVLSEQQYSKAGSAAEAGVVLLNTCAIR